MMLLLDLSFFATEIGLGREGIATLCEIFTMPPPVQDTDFKNRLDRASYCFESRFMYPTKFNLRYSGRTKSCEMLWESDMDLSVPPLGVQSEKSEN